MPFQAVPTVAGIYRIKVYDSDNDSYWQYKTDVKPPWIKRAKLDPSSNEFEWNITPISGSDSQFTITPVKDANVGLVSAPTGDPDMGYGNIIGQSGDSAEWTIKKNANDDFSKIYFGSEIYPLDSYVTHKNKDKQAVHFWKEDDRRHQKWVFELLRQSPPPPPPRPVTKSFEDLFFSYTPVEASKLEYDIIVVGTGIGGGIVAGDLFDTNSKLGSAAKSVLVIEKGGLTFHSHCLNASRPTGFGEDRAQQNDTFFSLFKEDYKGTEGNKDWKGGPMHTLGGRSAAWGLFAPRVHDETLRQQFAPGSGLDDELIETWYREAESLMNLSLPATTTTHQNLMERLNMKTKRDCQWQWGRIASEFHDDKNFDFAVGAYSTIDKLLEIAMSKDRKADGTSVEHPNWKILLGTEVRKVTWSTDNTTATGVVVRDAAGVEYTIKLKARAAGSNASLPAVVLGAGSVASPAILMRSGLTDFLTQNNGLHLTDHDIFAKVYTFRYLNPADRDRVGAMKLQTYLRPKPTSPIALANIAIDASSFLPRGPVGNDRVNQTFPMLTAAFIRPTALSKTNTIALDEDGEPVVTITRDVKTDKDKDDLKELQDVVIKAREVIQDALPIEILDGDDDESGEFFHYLELGGVAHELGTIPMPGLKTASYCVDSDLRLRNRKGVFVCDLSVFPYSPEVNTSLTLAALALRLSRSILPRLPITPEDNDKVYVMNQTGDTISVFVSNRAGVVTVEDRETLGPGAIISRKRKAGVAEAAFVYRLKYQSTTEFVNEPVLYIADPGHILTIE